MQKKEPATGLIMGMIGVHMEDCTVEETGICNCAAGADAENPEIVAYVREAYGWHGGVGDPPDDHVLYAIVRGALGFLRSKDPEAQKMWKCPKCPHDLGCYQCEARTVYGTEKGAP